MADHYPMMKRGIIYMIVLQKDGKLFRTAIATILTIRQAVKDMRSKPHFKQKVRQRPQKARNKMFCAKCQKDLVHCTCPDIEERLKKLMKNPFVQPAAEMNLRARAEAKIKPKLKGLDERGEGD